MKEKKSNWKTKKRGESTSEEQHREIENIVVRKKL